jgi:hypothetical protein
MARVKKKRELTEEQKQIRKEIKLMKEEELKKKRQEQIRIDLEVGRISRI